MSEVRFDSCVECNEGFSRDYGTPTLCNRCWNEKQREATYGYMKADRNTEAEVIRAKAIARAKRGVSTQNPLSLTETPDAE